VDIDMLEISVKSIEEIRLQTRTQVQICHHWSES